MIDLFVSKMGIVLLVYCKTLSLLKLSLEFTERKVMVEESKHYLKGLINLNVKVYLGLLWLC